MIDAFRKIVLEFEADLLRAIKGGTNEAALTSIRDKAFDRLRELKEGPSPPCLETLFDVAGEIGIKLNMALKVIKP